MCVKTANGFGDQFVFEGKGVERFMLCGWTVNVSFSSHSSLEPAGDKTLDGTTSLE